MIDSVAGNLDDLVLSPPYYAHDPEELRCLVTLSLPYGTANSPLGVVLVWEEAPSTLTVIHSGAQSGTDGGEGGEDDTRPGWAFLELQALDRAPEEVTVSSGGRSKRVWFPSVQEAEAASSPVAVSSSRVDAVSGSAPLPIVSGSQYSFDQQDHDDDDEDGYRDPAFGGRPATTTDNKAPVAGMAEGEGTTPGAYGSPNDFWANWSDDEEHASGTRSRGGYARGPEVAANSTTREGAEDAADEAYWSSYGGVDSVVGDDREDERPPPHGHEREETATAAGASTIGAGNQPKTRTRRSSTVTPNRAAAAAPLEFLTEANVQAASSAAAAAAAAVRPAIPRSQSHASGFAYPLDVGAVSDRLTRAQSRGSDSDDETVVDLRVAIEGIWRMYVGRGLTDAEELEDKKQRFQRVVAGVLAADV